MRATVSLLALVLATPALADEVFVQAPVTQAVVYPDGAELTLRAEVDLPAGEHVVMVPYGSNGEALPQVRASSGVEIGLLGYRTSVSANPRDLYDEAQLEAAETVDEVQDRLNAAADAYEEARATLAGLEAKAAYLASVTPPTDASPEDIMALGELVAAQTAKIRGSIPPAQAALRPLEDALGDLQGELAAAQAALERLAPPEAKSEMLAIELTTEAGGPVALEFNEQVWDAGWGIEYEMDLDRDTGMITLDRKVALEQFSDRVWSDTTLILATTRPTEATRPQPVYPDQADIYEKRARVSGLTSPAASAEFDAMAEPEPVMIEETPRRKVATASFDGLDVTYAYPSPVTIVPGELAELSLGALELQSETHIEAAPRWDKTAFLMARFTNETGEPILPGNVRLSRNGNALGEIGIGMIPTGAEEVIGFGPMSGVRLSTVFIRNEEGDQGLINKSSTRVQQITFSVENLMDEAQDVRTLFPLTFSEKEDLEVEVSALPAPDETDVDDKRGVSAWNLTVAPGETKTVEITVELDWPEGQSLDWNP